MYYSLPGSSSQVGFRSTIELEPGKEYIKSYKIGYKN